MKYVVNRYKFKSEIGILIAIMLLSYSTWNGSNKLSFLSYNMRLDVSKISSTSYITWTGNF